jgi:DNA-binding CsgD family transcriptional regulator
MQDRSRPSSAPALPSATGRLGDVPRYVGAAGERILAARGDADRLMRVFARTCVPAVLVDGERRYVEVNRPARLLLRSGLTELTRMRLDDLTPPHLERRLTEAWARLIETGCVAGSFEVAGPDGGRLAVVYCAASDALPGLHLIAFAPSGWSHEELCDRPDSELSVGAELTAREVEMLELAADGLSGPAIAGRLVLSPATVRTHFRNIYGKLGVGDRAAAVARAMRVGLIE